MLLTCWACRGICFAWGKHSSRLFLNLIWHLDLEILSFQDTYTWRSLQTYRCKRTSNQNFNHPLTWSFLEDFPTGDFSLWRLSDGYKLNTRWGESIQGSRTQTYPLIIYLIFLSLRCMNMGKTHIQNSQRLSFVLAQWCVKSLLVFPPGPQLVLLDHMKDGT